MLRVTFTDFRENACTGHLLAFSCPICGLMYQEIMNSGHWFNLGLIFSFVSSPVLFLRMYFYKSYSVVLFYFLCCIA